MSLARSHNSTRPIKFLFLYVINDIIYSCKKHTILSINLRKLDMFAENYKC